MAVEYDADGKVYRCLVGSTLRRQRQARGLTIHALAEATGTSPTALTGWELDKHEPTLTNLYRICRGLGMTLEELVREV